jgi:hypothetical protein
MIHPISCSADDRVFPHVGRPRLETPASPAGVSLLAGAAVYGDAPAGARRGLGLPDQAELKQLAQAIRMPVMQRESSLPPAATFHRVQLRPR